MKNSYIEFEPPAGFVLPESVQPGDSFSLVCDFKLKDSGKLCITQLGELDLDEPKEDKREDYSKMTRQMQSDYQPQPQE